MLVAAARDLFAQRGFGGTTTREIAERAGVDETILFRNFGSKEQIFHEAVARPIETFLRDYTDQWLSQPAGDDTPEQMLNAFAGSLYDLACANRSLLLAAVPNHLGHGVPDAFARLEQMAEQVAAAHGFDYDPQVAIRAAVALVISVAVFDRALFGGTDTPERDRVVTELTQLLTYGLTQRPD